MMYLVFIFLLSLRALALDHDDAIPVSVKQLPQPELKFKPTKSQPPAPQLGRGRAKTQPPGTSTGRGTARRPRPQEQGGLGEAGREDPAPSTITWERQGAKTQPPGKRIGRGRARLLAGCWRKGHSGQGRAPERSQGPVRPRPRRLGPPFS